MSAAGPMTIGVTIHATDRTIGIVELAREVEARGFASLYVPEHTHIPVGRATPPPTGDERLGDEYTRSLDPYTALAAAAAVTDTIRLGTGVSLVAQRDPIVLAKSIATVDHLSGGRFVLGVGFGWNREELADHGIAFGERRAVVRETVLAMRALWSNDVAGFDGDHVAFQPSWSWPKPIQQPGPPVLVGGGAGPKLFAAIAEYGDGWMPIGGAGVREALPTLRGRVADAGRDPDGLRIVPFGVIPDAGKLDHYRAIGCTEAVLRLPGAGRDAVLDALDRLVVHVER